MAASDHMCRYYVCSCEQTWPGSWSLPVLLSQHAFSRRLREEENGLGLGGVVQRCPWSERLCISLWRRVMTMKNGWTFLCVLWEVKCQNEDLGKPKASPSSAPGVCCVRQGALAVCLLGCFNEGFVINLLWRGPLRCAFNNKTSNIC